MKTPTKKLPAAQLEALQLCMDNLLGEDAKMGHVKTVTMQALYTKRLVCCAYYDEANSDELMFRGGHNRVFARATIPTRAGVELLAAIKGA